MKLFDGLEHIAREFREPLEEIVKIMELVLVELAATREAFQEFLILAKENRNLE